MSLNNLKQKKCKSNKVNDLSDLIKWLSDLWKAKDCTELWKAERSKQRNASTKWLNRTLTFDNVRQREVADYLWWLKQQKIFFQL